MYGFRLDYYLRKIILALIGIDLWILLRARILTKSIIRILSSLCRAVFLMALGAGFLLVYSLAVTKNQVSSSIYADEYSDTKLKEVSDRLFGIETASMDPEYFHLKTIIENLKNQANDLELNLKKMRSQYKDLAKIAGSNYLDQEIADYASEAAGGTVLDTPDTESYYEPWHQQTTLFGIPIWKANYFTPRKVIQPWTQAGECWAFKGSWGKIVIELAYPILIDKITLEHIPVSASLTGSINSAPKEFVIYGSIDQKFVKLDSFVYDIITGEISQTFELKETEEMKLHRIKTILIEIKSNWGHSDYTCIYRIKVHGKLSEMGDKYEGRKGINMD